MANDVRIELSLDGEKQFNQALKTCNAELKNMQTQVKATDAANKGAANSEDALAKKVDALGKASQSAKSKVETMQKIVEKQKKAQEEAAAALDKAKQKYGENSAEVQKAQTAYNNITNSVNKWENELGKAQIEESNINSELEKNKGYLEEAQNSTDKTAKSIDEYGKEVKDSDEETEDFNKTLAQTGAAEAMQKVCDMLQNTIGQVGKKALEAAKDLDKGYDTIVKKTGATGDSLNEFKDIADNIFGDMPEDMEDVGTALGEVNTRFGKTGKGLESLSRDFLKFARINDTDVNTSIDQVDRILTQYNRDSSEASKLLGMMSKRSQETGRDTGKLMQNLSDNAGVLQMFGFSLEESVNFMSQLEDNGIEASTAMQGLKKAASEYAQQGLSMRDGIKETIEAIQNAETEQEAWAIAQETFGSRGFTTMAKAIRDGKIDIDDLSESMTQYAGVVDETYEATLNGWDSMTVASNNLKIAGSELTEAFFDAAAPAVDVLTDALKGALDIFKSLPDEVQAVIGVIGGVGSIAAQVIPQIMNFYTQLMTLKVMKTLSGDSSGLTSSLKRLKSGLGAVTAVAAGVAIGMAAIDEASKQLTKDVTEFATKAEGLNSGYDTTRDSVRDLQETIDSYSTTQEKREAIEAKIAEVSETQRQAQRNYNDEVKDSKIAVESVSEAMFGELDPLSSLLNGLTNGAVRNKAFADAAAASKEATDATNETLQDTSADLETLNQMLAAVEEEEKQAAETVVNAEGEIVTAKDASISKVGEELAAWQNLNTEQQTIATNIATAVGAMKDSITGAVQSIGDFFAKVQEQEEISAQDMYANFQAQIAAMTEWEQNLVDLADAGINQGLLQYLADMGPSAANYVAAMKQGILDGTGATVDEWNAIYQEKLDLEGATNTEGEALLTAIGNLAAGGEEKFNEVAEALNAASKEDGTYIVAGMVDGINEAKAQAEEAAQTLGEDTVKAAATGAQVQSPSRATLQTGRFIDQGMINGIKALQNQVAQAGKMMATGVINAIKSANVPSAATGEGQKVGAGLARGLSSQNSVAVSAAKTLAAGVAQALRAQATANYNAAIYVMTQVSKGLTSGAATAKTTGSNAGRDIASQLAAGINANSGTASTAASNMASAAASAAGTLSTAAAYSAGYSLASGIASGIWAGQSLAINAAAQMAENALNAAKNKLKIKSPSRVFRDEVGVMAARGLAEGFNSELSIDTKGMVNAFVNGLPDVSQLSAVPNVYVYLGDRELTGVMTQGVVRNISGGVRAYGAAGGRR